MKIKILSRNLSSYELLPNFRITFCKIYRGRIIIIKSTNQIFETRGDFLLHVSCGVRISHSVCPIITTGQPPPHRIPINRHFPAISSLFTDGTPYLYNRWSDDRSRGMSINGHTREAVLLSYAPKRRGRPILNEREVSTRGDVDPRLCPRPSEAAHPGARGDKKREPGHVQPPRWESRFNSSRCTPPLVINQPRVGW